MKQACVTKWFKPMDPTKVDQYHEWLFQKEFADREKRKAEHEARIKAERDRLRQIQREKEKKRKEAEKARREEEERRRAEMARRKLEGQFVVPGVFIGGRLAAQNSDWILEAMEHHKLSSVLNCTPNVRNYFDTKSSDSNDADTDDQGDQELEELAQQLNQEISSSDKPDSNSQQNKMDVTESSTGPTTSEPSTTADAGDKKESNGSVEGSEAPVKPEGEEQMTEEEKFFKQLETLDDDAKLALLESIKLEGDEDEEEDPADASQEKEKEKVEGEAENKKDAAKELLDRHKSRLARAKGCLPGGATLAYKRIPIEDDGRVDVSEYFAVANEFIAGIVARGESVLVHCREGRSRSVTMVISYLVLTLKQTLAEAMETMHKAIFDENANAGFKKQLMQLDLSVHGVHSIDYASKRDRKAAINSTYNDNISEVTGAVVGRSKRPRRSTRNAARMDEDEGGDGEYVDKEDGDGDYDKDGDFGAPPTKVRATRSKMKSRATTRSSASSQASAASSSPIATPSTSQLAMDVSEESTDVVPNEEKIKKSPTKKSPTKKATTTPQAAIIEIPDESAQPTSPKKKTASPVKSKSPKKTASEDPAKIEVPPTTAAESMDVDIMNVTAPAEAPLATEVPFAPVKVPATKEAKPAAKPSSKPAASPSKAAGAKKKGTFPAQTNTLFNYFTKK